MKTTQWIILIATLVGAIILIYSFLDNNSSEEFLKEIRQEREEKDLFMKTGKGSPFTETKIEFERLNYYEPDLQYRVIGNLTPVRNKKIVILPTSDNKEGRYLEYAIADFDLRGKHHELLILEVMEANHRGTLFLAFADSTSALETYGGGRYLELKKIPGASTITLDFNRAYNPYCAYNDSYSCPLPPTQNIISVGIKAGEKKYHP